MYCYHIAFIDYRRSDNARGWRLAKGESPTSAHFWPPDGKAFPEDTSAALSFQQGMRKSAPKAFLQFVQVKIEISSSLGPFSARLDAFPIDARQIWISYFIIARSRGNVSTVWIKRSHPFGKVINFLQFHLNGQYLRTIQLQTEFLRDTVWRAQFSEGFKPINVDHSNYQQITNNHNKTLIKESNIVNWQQFKPCLFITNSAPW